MNASQLISLSKPVVEILILWVIYYQLLAFIKDTRAFEVLRGLIVLAVLFVISQQPIGCCASFEHALSPVGF